LKSAAAGEKMALLEASQEGVMEPLKRLRSQLGQGVARAWESLSEGWRELVGRSDGALTPFSDRPAADAPAPSESELDPPTQFPRWGLLAGETWETAQSIIIRIEIAGVKQEDLEISVQGRLLRIRGEKHATAATEGRRYHLMERAYGRFERSLALPHEVDGAAAELSVADGVVTVILPKKVALPPR
jgi:HSP20 family protein